jgi:hypothetical protein
MRKFLLIAAVLLLSSAWMLAQNPAQSTAQDAGQAAKDAQQAGQDAGQAAKDATQTASQAGGSSVEGCIGGSAGSYTLTDSSGKVYQLAGDTSKLGDHVGHDVKVTGTVASSAGAAAAGAAGATPTLTVKKVKMVAATCK